MAKSEFLPAHDPAELTAEDHDRYEARRQYRYGAGYAFYSDIGHAYIEDVMSAEPRQQPHTRQAGSRAAFDQDPGAYGVYVVANDLTELAVAKQRGLHAREFGRRGQLYVPLISAEDNRLATRHSFYFDGLQDMAFPFHFIPAVAVDAVRDQAAAIGLDETERRAFSLGDYADIMRSSWLKRLVGQMAVTQNLVWQDTGMGRPGYMSDGLNPAGVMQTRLGFENAPYTSTITTQSIYGHDIAVASIGLSRAARFQLANRLHDPATAGCPVAAGQRLVDPADRHVQRLVANGYMDLRERADGQTVGQQYTPIDHAADAIAAHFDWYLQRYGQPGV